MIEDKSQVSQLVELPSGRWVQQVDVLRIEPMSTRDGTVRVMLRNGNDVFEELGHGEVAKQWILAFAAKLNDMRRG